MGKYVEILQQSVANFSFVSRSVTRKYVNQTVNNMNNEVFDTKKKLVGLHVRLKHSQMKANGCNRRWKMLVDQCQKAEVIFFCFNV